MGVNKIYMMIVILWASMIVMVNANCNSGTIVQACKYFNSSDNYEYSAVFDDICYSFSGHEVKVQTFGEAYDACNGEKGKPTNGFDYGRVGVFKTPDTYKQFMTMLQKKVVNEYIILGAVNDGRPGGLIHEFAWALDKAKSMCYVFSEDGDPGSNPSGTTVTKVGTAGGGPGNEKHAPNDLPSSYYVLCGNPYEPLEFKGYANSDLGKTYICEFGCGTAPDYTSSKTPEWWGGQSVTTTTSTTTSTAKPTTTTTSTASATCDKNYLSTFANAPNTGYFDEVGNPDFGGPTVYFFMEQLTGRSTWDREAHCYVACNATGAQARLATFVSYAIYEAVWTSLSNLGKDEHVIFGAGGYSTGTTLADFRWLCWGLPCNKSVITTSANFPITNNNPSAVELVLALDTIGKDGFHAYNLTGPPDLSFLCQCQCSSYEKLSSTSQYWDKQATSTSSTTSSSTAGKSTSISTGVSSPQAPTPSLTCDVAGLANILTALIDAILDALLHLKPPPPPAPFNSGLAVSETINGQTTSYFYGFVDVSSDKPLSSLSQMDGACATKCHSLDDIMYGRTAVLRSMDSYEQTYDWIRGLDTAAVVIGAATPDGASATTLNHYYWTSANTNNPSTTSPIMTQSTLVVEPDPDDGLGSSMALIIYPSKTYPSAFISFNATTLSGLDYLCECGCTPYTTDIGSTAPGWDTPTTTTTLSSTTSSSSSSTSASASSTGSSTSSIAIAISSVSTTIPTTSSTSNGAICDNTFMQTLRTSITANPLLSPFNSSLFYNESYANNTMYWYGYVKDTPSAGLTSLIAIDSDCSSKCQSASPLLYGRSAVMRSWEAYQAGFSFLKNAGFCGGCKSGVIIGAASYKTKNTFLNEFYWTTVNTNDPDLTKQLATEATVAVGKGSDAPGKGPTMALGIDLTGATVETALYSYDADKLDDGYLCECGCAPVSVTTTITSTTTTASTTSTLTSTEPALTSTSLSSTGVTTSGTNPTTPSTSISTSTTISISSLPSSSTGSSGYLSTSGSSSTTSQSSASASSGSPSVSTSIWSWSVTTSEREADAASLSTTTTSIPTSTSSSVPSTSTSASTALPSTSTSAAPTSASSSSSSTISSTPIEASSGSGGSSSTSSSLVSTSSSTETSKSSSSSTTATEAPTSPSSSGSVSTTPTTPTSSSPSSSSVAIPTATSASNAVSTELTSSSSSTPIWTSSTAPSTETSSTSTSSAKTSTTVPSTQSISSSSAFTSSTPSATSSSSAAPANTASTTSTVSPTSSTTTPGVVSSSSSSIQAPTSGPSSTSSSSSRPASITIQSTSSPASSSSSSGSISSSGSPPTSSSPADDGSSSPALSSSSSSASTAEATGEQSASTIPSVAMSQSTAESTVPSSSTVSSSIAPIALFTSSDPSSPSISTNMIATSSESQAISTTEESSSSPESSTPSTKSSPSSSESVLQSSSTSMSSITVIELGSESTATASSAIISSAVLTTDDGSTEGFSTTDRRTSSNLSSTNLLESTPTIPDTVPDTTSPPMLSTAGTTTGLTAQSTPFIAAQSTLQIEQTTEDYDETTATATPSGTPSPDLSSSQERTTLPDSDPEVLTSSFMDNPTTISTLEATSASTLFQTSELMNQPSTDTSQEASSSAVQQRFSSTQLSSTSTAMAEPSSSSPTAAISGTGTGNTHRGMARTEGTMAPLDQLIMETESASISSASSGSNAATAMSTDRAPATLLASLAEVTSEAEATDTPIVMMGDNQHNQEDPIDLAINPIAQETTDMDQDDRRDSEATATSDRWDSFTKSASWQEHSTSMIDPDSTTSMIQRRSISTADIPMDQQPSTVSTLQGDSIATSGLYDQSFTTGIPQRQSTSTIDTRPPDQTTSMRVESSSSINYGSLTVTMDENLRPASSSPASQPTDTSSGPPISDAFSDEPVLAQSQSATSKPNSLSSETQTASSPSLPSSFPNLNDLLAPTSFRLPPNVHIDNSVTLRSRSGNGGNSNQNSRSISEPSLADSDSLPISSQNQSSMVQGSSTSSDLVPSPYSTGSLAYAGDSSRSILLSTKANELPLLITIGTPGFNAHASPDGANMDADQDRTQIPLASTDGSITSESGGTTISGDPDLATSKFEAYSSTDPVLSPSNPEPRQLDFSSNAPGATDSRATPKGITGSGTNGQPIASTDKGVSKSSDPPNLGHPNDAQQLPNDTTNNEALHRITPTSLPNESNALVTKPSTDSGSAMSQDEQSGRTQEASRAPDESNKPSSSDSANTESKDGTPPNPMGPTSAQSVDNIGSTGPMTSLGPMEGSVATVTGGTGQAGDVSSTGPAVSPSDPAAHTDPTSITSIASSDSTVNTIPTEPSGLTGSTDLSLPADPSTSSNPNSATDNIPPSTPATVSSADRPTNDSAQGTTNSGKDSSQDSSTSAGDMDEEDIKKPRPVDPMSKPERLAANIMHSLGCIWVVACSGACFVLGMITNYRSPDRQLSYSQELSLMLQHLFILLWHDATEHNTLCTAVSVSIQYFTLVYYTSMLLDSIRNFLIIVAFLNRANQIPSLAMQAAAWGAPALITSASAIMYYKHYDSDFSCWINADHPVALFTIAPVGLMVALGIIINEASGTLMPCQLVPKGLKDSFNTSFISRHGFFFVLPLSISSWAIGFSAVFYQKLPVYVTVSGINIGLGIALVFFHALQNDKIRALLNRSWTKIKSSF